MNMKIKLLLAAVLVVGCLPLQGCAVAAIGAGISAVSYATSQKQRAYTDYRNHAEKLNFDREKAGLKPNPILTFKEWSKGDR